MDEKTIMSFGKYKGRPLSEIPDGYFLFLYDRKLISGELKKYIEKTVPVLKTKYISTKKSPNKNNR